MSFLSRRKAELAESGVDASRVPPGQYVTDRFPPARRSTQVQMTKGIGSRFVGEPSPGLSEMLAMPQRGTFEFIALRSGRSSTRSGGGAVSEVSRGSSTQARARARPRRARIHSQASDRRIVRTGDSSLPLRGRATRPDHGWPWLVVPHPIREVGEVGARLVYATTTSPALGTQRHHMYGRPWPNTRYWATDPCFEHTANYRPR